MGTGRGLTARGWAFLLGGIGAGIAAGVLRERDLLFITFLTGTLLILAWGLSRAQVLRSRVQASYSVTPTAIHAGDRATVRVHLRNVSRTVLRLDIAQPAVAHLVPARRELLPPIEPGATRDLAIDVTAAHRGTFRLDAPTMHELDPLGLWSTIRTLEASLDVVVLPAVVQLDGLPRGLRGRQLASGGAGETGGRSDAGVRAYRNGDDPRTIHWRASSRLEDDLVVRLSEPDGLGHVRLVVDDRLRFTKDGAATREATIALAASIGTHLDRHGVELSVVTVGGQVLASGRDVSESLLVALAALPSAEQARTAQGKRGAQTAANTRATRANRSGKPADLVIAVLGEIGEAHASALAPTRRGRAGSLAFVADPHGANDLAAEGWRVVVLQGEPAQDAAGNAARFARAWHDGLQP